MIIARLPLMRLRFDAAACACVSRKLVSSFVAAPPVDVADSSEAVAGCLQRGGLRARLVRVSTGDTLDLGQGHQMSFFLSGTPRWPEGTCTFHPAFRPHRHASSAAIWKTTHYGR
jgi:hypothetical protein